MKKHLRCSILWPWNPQRTMLTTGPPLQLITFRLKDLVIPNGNFLTVFSPRRKVNLRDSIPQPSTPDASALTTRPRPSLWTNGLKEVVYLKLEIEGVPEQLFWHLICVPYMSNSGEWPFNELFRHLLSVAGPPWLCTVLQFWINVESTVVWKSLQFHLYVTNILQ